MKKVKTFLTMSLILLALFSNAVGEYPNKQGNVTSAQKLDAATKGTIIEEITALIEEKYVFPDVAEKIVKQVLCLPIYGDLEEEKLEKICKLLK